MLYRMANALFVIIFILVAFKVGERKGYVSSCQHIYTNLYTNLNIKDIDQKSLKEHCDAIATDNLR